MRSCALVVCELVIFVVKLSRVHPLPVLNLHTEDGATDFTEEHGTDGRTELDTLLNYNTSPVVDIYIRGTSRQPTNYHTSVPAVPDMSVLTAFIFATRQYSRQYGRFENPFNISFIWDEPRGCYVVVSVVGEEMTLASSWHVVIRSTFGEFVYFDQCFPMDDDVILRPGYQVILIYSRNKWYQP